jgi:endonuclease YncB( thermonuclease family)
MKALFFLAAFLWIAHAEADVLAGRVVGIADGDTVTVLDESNGQHRIRLSGIDAPEKGQPYGMTAKENLSRMVFGKPVTVVWHKLDRYGRIVGKVETDGKDAGLEQLRVGLAWHYQKYAYEQPENDRRAYAAAEEEARTAKRGLWADKELVPPWEWRRKH